MRMPIGCHRQLQRAADKHNINMTDIVVEAAPDPAGTLVRGRAQERGGLGWGRELIRSAVLDEVMKGIIWSEGPCTPCT